MSIIVTKNPNPCAITYHTRMDFGQATAYSRSWGNPKGVASVLLEIPGVSDVYTNGYTVTVCKGPAFADDEVFPRVEAIIRGITGEVQS